MLLCKELKHTVTINQFRRLGIEKNRKIQEILHPNSLCLLPEHITIDGMFNVLINSEYGFPQITTVKSDGKEMILVKSMNENMPEFSGTELCDVLWDVIVYTKITDGVNV